MGQAGRGDEARGKARPFGQFKDRVGRMTFNTRAIPEAGFLQDAERAGIDFGACHHRRRGGGGVGNLKVVAVSLGQGHVWQRVHGQRVGFAVEPTLLASIDTCSCYGRYAHAIANEEDDILGRFYTALLNACVYGFSGRLIIGIACLNGRRAFA